MTDLISEKDVTRDTQCPAAKTHPSYSWKEDSKSDTKHFTTYTGLYEWCEDTDVDAVPLDDLRDWCNGIELPEDRFDGFRTTVDGDIGVTVTDLKRIVTYLESRQ